VVGNGVYAPCKLLVWSERASDYLVWVLQTVIVKKRSAGGIHVDHRLDLDDKDDERRLKRRYHDHGDVEL
jgi:hypothetical protein